MAILDQLILQFDQGLRTLFADPPRTERPNPAANISDVEMSDAQKQAVASLMRVNHAGEISAQGLYQGQAITARLPEVRQAMERAAMEENDHLDWCQQRLNELGSHTSYLNICWYTGSLLLGMAAGLAGDKWSLGFVAETEHQVVAHLASHLQRIPENDAKTRAILQQMQVDESHHRNTAFNAGAADLPAPIKTLMQIVSKVMTTTAARI